MISTIDAVGHRVVHGGESFSESVLVKSDTKEILDSLAELAPLHNPANVMGIRAAESLCPKHHRLRYLTQLSIQRFQPMLTYTQSPTACTKSTRYGAMVFTAPATFMYLIRRRK